MGSQSAMVETGGLHTAADVTIYLVPPNFAMEQGNVARKRARQSLEPPVPLGEIHAESWRLRQCSRYFEACMSERWTASTQREFYLEVHTEVRFYHECFARMHSPFKPISSVATCIQLLKVASQIQYDEVVENGLRYLSAVPWSGEEEKQIRSFYDSWQLAFNITSDLSKRLQVPSNGEERQENLLKLIQKALSFSLQTTCSDPLSSTSRSRKQSQTVFWETFKAIMAGTREPGKCCKVLPIVITLIIEESEKILLSIKKGCQEGAPQGARAIWAHQTIFLNNLGKFGWLFGAVRSASSAQAMVELLLKDREFPLLLQSKFQSVSLNLGSKSLEEKRWSKMMGTIFHDVLDGRLFLKTSERLALFQRWNWLLKADNFEPNAPLSPTLVSDFIMGFPHEDQEEIFRCWVSNLDDPAHQADCDLSEAHILWMKHLVSKAEKPADAPGCSSTG